MNLKIFLIENKGGGKRWKYWVIIQFHPVLETETRLIYET